MCFSRETRPNGEVPPMPRIHGRRSASELSHQPAEETRHVFLVRIAGRIIKHLKKLFVIWPFLAYPILTVQHPTHMDTLVMWSCCGRFHCKGICGSGPAGYRVFDQLPSTEFPISCPTPRHLPVQPKMLVRDSTHIPHVIPKPRDRGAMMQGRAEQDNFLPQILFYFERTLYPSGQHAGPTTISFKDAANSSV